jgi:DnaK suppressor protein
MSAKDTAGRNAPGNGHARFSEVELESLRKALLDKRGELTSIQANQLSARRGSDKHHLADLEEMADSAEDDSFCEIMDLGASTIDQIDRALEKIDEGSYGFCEACDQPIHRARLSYLPFATLCVDCQRQEERKREAESWITRSEE